MKRQKDFVFIVIGLGILSIACSSPGFLLTPTPTPSPTPVPTPTSPPTATPIPTDTGWTALSDGVEVRSLNVVRDAIVERVTVVRLPPASVEFRVLYSPGEPHLIHEWALQTGALLTVNAGYFTPEYQVTGLTISDGVASGLPFGDFAGMFAVTQLGVVSIRWLRNWPYDPAEALREAVQSFPVLVKPGGMMGFPVDADDGRVSRRTVVAQDRSGRILFLVAPSEGFSLHSLATWLVESDLDVDIALNLDGGASSGLWMMDADLPQIDSLTPVPAVITVFPR